MIPGKQYTPADLLQIVWQRRWWLLGPFALITAATVFTSYQLQDRYRSETLIVVIPQRVPEEYVRSTVTARIEDRLPSMSQQILSRTRLESIVDDFGLYAELRASLVMEDIVQRMRNDIEIEISQGDAFRVIYEARDPTVSMRVTERLAALFIEENLRDRETLARDTRAFLESQLEEARARLLQQEARLEEYRLTYAGELPDQLGMNLQVIQNTQLQLLGLTDRLNRDRDRRLVLERGLADLRAEATVGVTSQRSGSEAEGFALPTAPAAVQLQAALDELRNMELRLTPEHPDVVRLKRIVQDLEKTVEAERAAPTGDERIISASELIRRNRRRALEAELESVDRQIAATLEQEQELHELITTYQRRAEAVPKRESELVALTRDYETLQSLYESLLTKREDSKIAENLEVRQIGQQFKVLDPASFPERPSWPDRMRINLIGALAGLVLGGGLVFMLEWRDATLKTVADVQLALGAPVLAMIPFMLTTVDFRARRLKKRVLLTTGTLALVALAALAAVFRESLAVLFRG